MTSDHCTRETAERIVKAYEKAGEEAPAADKAWARTLFGTWRTSRNKWTHASLKLLGELPAYSTGEALVECDKMVNHGVMLESIDGREKWSAVAFDGNGAFAQATADTPAEAAGKLLAELKERSVDHHSNERTENE